MRTKDSYLNMITHHHMIRYEHMKIWSMSICVLQDGALFYKKSGLGALPLALFNGVPLSPDEMDPDELETVILQRIMDGTTTFQRAVFMVRHFCHVCLLDKHTT